jgi:hypothetical protein
MKADHISKARRHQDLPNIGPSITSDLDGRARRSSGGSAFHNRCALGPDRAKKVPLRACFSRQKWCIGFLKSSVGCSG